MRNISKTNEAGRKSLGKKIGKGTLQGKLYLMDGNQIQIQCKEISSEDGLNSKSLFILFTDISMIQKLESAKAESKYKEMLMTTITHELRTPTNGTLSMLELLQSQNLDDQGKDFLQIGVNSCHLLLNLINDILVSSLFECLFTILGLF